MAHRNTPVLAWLVCSVIVAAAGCNDSTTAADTPDLAMIKCQSDRDCTDVAAPFCDTKLHQCVNCTQQYQTCPQGFACIDLYGGGFPYCVESCSSAGDCTKGETGCCQHGCTDLLTNRANCGACGHKCDPWLVCESGTCTCPTYAPDLCSGSCTNLLTDATSCGTCGKRCPAQPNRYPQCQAGACVPGTCQFGYADCDGNPDNGCEQVTIDNDSNCGTCGTICPQGQRCHYQSCY